MSTVGWPRRSARLIDCPVSEIASKAGMGLVGEPGAAAAVPMNDSAANMRLAIA